MHLQFAATGVLIAASCFLLISRGGMEAREEYILSGALVLVTIAFAALSSSRKAVACDPALGHMRQRAIQTAIADDRELIQATT